jgi:glucose-1-phosphate adenylyltransferase
MDLVAGRIDLDGGRWPIQTAHNVVAPSRMVAAKSGAPVVVSDTLVAGGTVIEGTIISGSVLAPGVTVGPGAWVEDSVLLDGVIIGPEAVVRRAVVGERTKVPAFATLDLTVAARARWTVSPGGVVVVTRGDRIGVRKRGEPRRRTERNRPQAPVPLQLVADFGP